MQLDLLAPQRRHMQGQRDSVRRGMRRAKIFSVMRTSVLLCSSRLEPIVLRTPHSDCMLTDIFNWRPFLVTFANNCVFEKKKSRTKNAIWSLSVVRRPLFSGILQFY